MPKQKWQNMSVRISCNIHFARIEFVDPHIAGMPTKLTMRNCLSVYQQFYYLYITQFGNLTTPHILHLEILMNCKYLEQCLHKIVSIIAASVSK